MHPTGGTHGLSVAGLRLTCSLPRRSMLTCGHHPRLAHSFLQRKVLQAKGVSGWGIVHGAVQGVITVGVAVGFVLGTQAGSGYSVDWQTAFR